MLRFLVAGGALALALVPALGRPAAAQLPDAATVLAEIGFSKDQIAEVEAGKFVSASIQPSSKREIVAAFAFLVQASPADIVKQLRAGLVDKTDSNTIAFGMIKGAPSLDSFAKLTLRPDADKRAQTYLHAKPGSGLNLSNEEIATFGELGSGATTAAVEQAIRSALLARLQAYQAKGLAGITPYAGADGNPRSPAEEIRSATQATKKLQAMLPNAHALLLDYPGSKPPGTEEAYRWEHYNDHGVPTMALEHSLYVPEGDAWVIAQRQFYVSGGYTSEQAIGAFLPKQNGTLVIYTNRTSTDQVTGFGGAAKVSIGSKLLASQLETLYQEIQSAEKKQTGY